MPPGGPPSGPHPGAGPVGPRPVPPHVAASAAPLQSQPQQAFKRGGGPPHGGPGGPPKRPRFEYFYYNY